MYRELVRRALNHLGYDVHRIASFSSLDFAGAGTDPLTVEYVPHRRGFVVFDVRIADVRGFSALALQFSRDMHPFVLAMSAALDEENEDSRRRIVHSILAHYYRIVQPTSALDVVDLPEAEAPGLAGVPAFGHIVPWSHESVTEAIDGRIRHVRFEGIQNRTISNIRDGLTAFGPVAPPKLTLEVHRICKLLASVRCRGFLPQHSESPLKIAGLRHGDEYRWSTESGQHRFAMATAVGLQVVPARVVRVIRREDARYWPQVVNGVFTIEGAEKVFDRMFEGRPAAVCNDWIAMNRRQDSGSADPPALVAGRSRGRD